MAPISPTVYCFAGSYAEAKLIAHDCNTQGETGLHGQFKAGTFRAVQAQGREACVVAELKTVMRLTSTHMGVYFITRYPGDNGTMVPVACAVSEKQAAALRTMGAPDVWFSELTDDEIVVVHRAMRQPLSWTEVEA